MLPRRALGAFARLPSAIRATTSPLRTIPTFSRNFNSSSSSKLATVADLDAIDSLTIAPSADTMGFEMSQATSSSATVVEGEGRPIYLDMQATTPTDPRVLDAMLPFMTNQYGNPHSKTHAYGWETEQAVEDGRKHVADLIGANAKDIIFTSGATESNNMSIKGIARFYKGKKNHMFVQPAIAILSISTDSFGSITTQTEHKCVLDSCRVLQDEGFEVTYLPVQTNGLVDLKLLEESIRPETCLVSVSQDHHNLQTGTESGTCVDHDA